MNLVKYNTLNPYNFQQCQCFTVFKYSYKNIIYFNNLYTPKDFVQFFLSSLSISSPLDLLPSPTPKYLLSCVTSVFLKKFCRLFTDSIPCRVLCPLLWSPQTLLPLLNPHVTQLWKSGQKVNYTSQP